MEISYKFTPKEINKISKFKNPSILLDKNKIIQNGKYKIYLTKNMFNKLLEENQLKYVFTDKRKNYYVQNGGNLGNIFKSHFTSCNKLWKKIITSFSSYWTAYNNKFSFNK